MADHKQQVEGCQLHLLSLGEGRWMELLLITDWRQHTPEVGTVSGDGNDTTLLLMDVENLRPSSLMRDKEQDCSNHLEGLW